MSRIKAQDGEGATGYGGGARMGGGVIAMKYRVLEIRTLKWDEYAEDRERVIYQGRSARMAAKALLDQLARWEWEAMLQAHGLHASTKREAIDTLADALDDGRAISWGESPGPREYVSIIAEAQHA